MGKIISNEKRAILDKFDRAKHLAHREEILTLIQYKQGKIKKNKNIDIDQTDMCKSIEDLEMEADFDLAESDYVEINDRTQKRESEYLDAIELSLDKKNLSEASELFEQFLNYSYNTLKKRNSKHLAKCTTMWTIRYYLSLSTGELTRSEQLAKRLVELHEQVFSDGRVEKRREVFNENKKERLKNLFREFAGITNGTLDDFIDFIQKSVDDLDFHCAYDKKLTN